jgi:hypothetical protein
MCSAVKLMKKEFLLALRTILKGTEKGVSYININVESMLERFKKLRGWHNCCQFSGKKEIYKMS